jgi:hypothetical protein
MAERPFQPSPHAANGLIVIAAAALFYAFYVRYFLIENAVVGLACEGGASTTNCQIRKIAIELFRYEVFGILALAAALLQFLRPNTRLAALALAATPFGLVLYNNGLAALAVALVILSFARPGRVRGASTPPPAPRVRRRTTSPASSRKFH